MKKNDSAMCCFPLIKPSVQQHLSKVEVRMYFPVTKSVNKFEEF